MIFFLLYYLLILPVVLLVCSSFSLGFVMKTGILRLPKISLSSTNIPTKESQQSIQNPYCGLLSGLADASTAKHYSMNLPIKEAAELVKNTGQLYDIIERDV